MKLPVLGRSAFKTRSSTIILILIMLSLSLNSSGQRNLEADGYMQKFISVRYADIDSALYYAQKANSIANESGDSLMIVRSENAIGWAYKEKGFFEIAIQHYLLALRIATNNGYVDRQKYIINNLALSYYYGGNYARSLYYNLESLVLREESGDQKEIAVSCNNIGLVYYKIKDYDKAVAYFKRALRINESLGGQDIEYNLLNLGLCYLRLNEYSKSIEYFERVVDLCQDNCSSDILIEAHVGLGDVYLGAGRINEAAKSFNKALELASENNRNDQIIIIYNFLAKIELKRNQLKDALFYLDESQDIALELNYKVWISQNYQLYAELHARNKDFERAFEYQSKYDSLNSTILNEEVIKNLAEIQADYQERENLETIASQDQELSRRNTLLILSAIIILLTTSIVIIFYRVSRLRKRTNKQLADAKAIIEQQNNVLEEKVRERTKELKQANAALVKSNKDLDTFIYKTSHDIRGPLATLQGMCSVALIDIKEPKALEYFQKIGKTAFQLNEILSKLLVINQINNALVSMRDIDLIVLVDEIVQEQAKAANGSDVTVDNRLNGLGQVRSDPGLVKIILNNLISNAYKFRNTSNRVESWIRLEAVRENGHLAFSVIDNGVGIDENASSKIFEIFSKTSEVSDSAGLGLYLVKLAVEKLKGQINHSKTEDGHTKFTVELPVG